ncbi:MAG: DNA alkylation repair protein [Candidatus Puniceispirillum sp.]|nr:DNA alkylation repair protein [Candidatus Pelagibacter sp.]MBA4283254.1 DNA alkylation repair protein [Candidatus Puniceispirillum sp.]
MISLKDISAARREQLNSGEHETKNLVECLSIDFRLLVLNCIPGISNSALDQIEQKKQCGIIDRMKGIGSILFKEMGVAGIDVLKNHHSDSIRGLSCYMVSYCDHLSLVDKFEMMKTLADDSHFSVREWAWLALRPDIVCNIKDSLTFLQSWSSHESPYLRRFACEATRPRGVWCAHIPELKINPNIALPLLAMLKTDTHLYVQKSLGNWLNDASKNNADWVLNILELWHAEYPGLIDKRISKLAKRTMNKVKSKKYD